MVLDCAHGAAYRTAPRLLKTLGAEVFPLGCSPDGRNINTGCGALDTAAMRREVLRRGAHCGISLDGDADRALLADERGRLLDGDALIALAALDLQRKGLLKGGKVVVTVMSNYGMIRYLSARGIAAVQVPVGDRNVTDALEEGGLSLGGENSGHVVFRRLAPTGDGLLTALQTLAVLVESGGGLSRFRSLYPSFPQLLKNLRVAAKVPLADLPALQRSIRQAGRSLSGRGRVFVRYSGTEPVLRFLVEGPDRALVRRICAGLVASYRRDIRSRGIQV